MMDNDTSLYLAGMWVAGEGAPFTSYNPADGSVVWHGSAATPTQASSAIASARQALPMWSSLPLAVRIGYLDKCRSLFLERRADLARLIAAENGKPLWDADNEMQALLDKFEISINAYNERCSQKNLTLPTGTGVVRHRPYGVVAVLGPFNFPAHIPHGHIIPSLLAGNTVVFKCSEETPGISEMLVRCWHDSGLPAGVLNLLQGGATVGATVGAAPDIDALLFTGSYKTGRHLLELSSQWPGRLVALEMGGNNPLVVWKADDLTAAAYITIQSSFLSSGQRCSSARRLIVPDDATGQQFLDILCDLTSRLRIGAYTDTPEPFMGPLISPRAADHVYAAYANLAADGATPLLPMQRLSGAAFLTPGIVDITALPPRPDQEIFGPLLQVLRVATFDEALSRANATSYGLTAGILTDDASLYDTFWNNIRAGVINWNTPTTGVSGHMPFGGTGNSGNCRPAAYSAADYTSYPVSSIEKPRVTPPSVALPGLPPLNPVGNRE